jgi:hypothetical protein
MAEAGDQPLTIFCTNPSLNIATDFRIRFLVKRYGVKCGYVADTCPISIKHRFITFVIKSLRHSNSWTKWLIKKLIGHQKECCTPAWAENVLNKLSPKVIIFDWCKIAGTPTGALANAAAKRNIPLIAVPHGLNTMTNDYRSTVEIGEKVPAPWGKHLSQMDFVTVQHHDYGKWLTLCEVEPEKILVMGSTRFCHEWHEIYSELIPASLLRRKPGKLHIVYFDHLETFRLNTAAIEQTLNALLAMDDVELIVKPSTGANQYSSSLLKHSFHNGKDIHSNRLVEWSDIVMGSTSSILVEAHLQEKTLIYPRYFHENKQMFDEMGACLAVNDLAELTVALEKLHAEPGRIPYPQENVDAFLTEVAYGGSADRDVLGGYRQLVVAASEHRLKQGPNWNPIFD